MVIRVPECGADPAELQQIAPPAHPAGQVTLQVTPQVEVHDEAHDLLETERSILKACQGTPQSAQELLDILGYKTRTGNFKKAMNRLLDELELLEKTLPQATRSKNQKYRLTTKGRQVLENIE